MTTIWEMWPKSQYVKTQTTSNPMRCIMQTPDWRQTYFENMSQAVAEMCSVFATVMTVDIQKIPDDGIWHNIEFPTLQLRGNQGQVDFVEVISPDGKQEQKLWSRFSSRLLTRGKNHVEKRDPIISDDCGIDNDDVAGDFDEGTDFEVIW